MGIQNLLPALAPIARPVASVPGRYAGLAAAVDVAAWLHRGISAIRTLDELRALADRQHGAWYEAETAGGENAGNGGGEDMTGGEAGAGGGTEGPSRRIDFDRVAVNPSDRQHQHRSHHHHQYQNYHRSSNRQHEQRGGGDGNTGASDDPLVEAATSAVVGYALRLARALLAPPSSSSSGGSEDGGPGGGLASLLLVVDGGSLPSKSATDADRRRRRRECYRMAREAEASSGTSGATISGAELRKLYVQSVGVSHEVRRALVERVRRDNGNERNEEERTLRRRRDIDIGGDDANTNNDSGLLRIDALVAPYEADAQMASLAHRGAVDVVLSDDSDLLCYGCPRVCFKLDVTAAAPRGGHGNGGGGRGGRGRGGRGGTGTATATATGQEIQLLRDLGTMGAGSGAAARGGNGSRGGGGGGGTKTSSNASSASSQLSFQNWTHDMFVYMCILAGCDYCPGVPGVGIKTAHKLVRMYRTPARIFRALRAAGRMPPPTNTNATTTTGRDGGGGGDDDGDDRVVTFEESFWTAYRTFRHQTVYNPATGEAEPLLPIVEVASAASPDWDAVGPMMDGETARGIATGRIHPAQRIPWEAVLAADRASRAKAKVASRASLSTSIVPLGGGGGQRNRYQANQFPAAASRRRSVDDTDRYSPISAGRARRTLANSKDLFKFFARKPKGGSDGTGAGDDGDSPGSSPSSRGGRNRPPLREIFVNNTRTDSSGRGNGPKDGDSRPPTAASVTNQRGAKSSRGIGGGRQPIPIHFGDYSSTLVGASFQPLSRQNHRAGDDAENGRGAGGAAASRNISRAVQRLRANASRGRVLKYRARGSPNGGREETLGGIGCGTGQAHPNGGASTSRLQARSNQSIQSIQSAPDDSERANQSHAENSCDPIYGRSSLDAHRDGEHCQSLGWEEDSRQFYSETEPEDRELFEGTFDEELLQRHESEHSYGRLSPVDNRGYGEQYLENGRPEVLEPADEAAGFDLGYLDDSETLAMSTAVDQVQGCYQEQEVLGADAQGYGPGNCQQDAFEYREEDGEDYRARASSLLNNSFDPISQQMGPAGYAQPSESLDLSVSSPQLKRPNRNATPNFRSASESNIDTGFGDDVGGDGIDHQFVLEEGRGGVDHSQYFLSNAQGCDLLEGDIANIGPPVDPETRQHDEGAHARYLGTFDDETAEEGRSANYLSEYDGVQLGGTTDVAYESDEYRCERDDFICSEGVYQY